MAFKVSQIRRVRTEFVSCVVFLLAISPVALGQLPLHSIETWGQTFGQKIHEFCARATALEDIRLDYVMMESVSIQPVDGQALAAEMKLAIEEMLERKVSAVQKLVDATEEAHAEQTIVPALNVSEFHLSKRLDLREFPLEENQQFNYTKVNTEMSTVHVPTNIFDESSTIGNGTSWSRVLDDTFVQNYEDDNTLTWQYFCSTTGFLRIFPGAPWETSTYNEDQKLDTFDCRARSWYIRAAAYPKDVVILLDSSGSMKGLRSVVAKATVSKLLDTLGADDYVNVLTFSETVKYLDTCFNATMVQATDSHKKRLKEALKDVEASNIADLALALEWAFELLKSTNESRKGSLCNKAVMIITDGAGETYEQVFQKYNWPQLEIRVFTYLIGREIRDTKNVLWMACRNKGMLFHFSSLADVHEHFQEYVHVFSRPMAIERARHLVWSDVYLDALEPGLGLMTTVAQPAFNIRTGKLNRQEVLGVVGTDVPIKEILKLTPPHALGVNGYSFAVTSNGYVVFHPKLNNEKNLNDMESLLIDIADFEIRDEDFTLRQKMIDRKTETLKMKSVLTYDQKRRAIVRDYNYYITAIEETPFSLGIALPQSTGMFKLNGTKSLQEADLLDLSTSDVMLAPWNYCKMDTNETKQNSVDVLMKYLIRAKNDTVFYEKHCDTALVGSLLFDAEATRNAAVNWRKADFDEENDTHSHRNGVELVFIGTKSGLTRYLYFNSSPTDRKFLPNHRSATEATYYTRAVLNGNGIFTFSVPFRNDKEERPMIVTASTPVSVDMKGEEAIAGVVGMQMKYSKFYEIFMNSTRVCDNHEPNCAERTCSSNNASCYLLDDNGYVILSKDDNEVGRFFGELDGKGAIMNELIIDESDEDHDSGIFKRLPLTEYHTLCDVYTGILSSSSSGFLIEPFRNILFLVKNIIHELFLFFIQFNFFNWFLYTGADGDFDGNMTEQYTSEDNFDYSIFYEGIDPEDKIVSSMMFECAQMIDKIPTRSQEKREKVKNCFDDIIQRIQPRFVGLRSCIKQWHYYNADPNQLPQDGTATSCQGTDEECANKFSASRVPHTNLVLLVIDTRCSCAQQAIVKADPVEIIYNKTYECDLLQREIYRKRPHECYAQSSEEDYSECGMGNQVHPALLSVLTLSAITTYVLYKYHLIT